MRIKVTQTPLLHTGEYVVRLSDIIEVQGRYGTRLRFKFVVEDYDIVLYEYVSPSSESRSRCIRWASALLGRRLREGEELDLSELIGKYANAVVIRKQAADGEEINTIHMLLPIQKDGGDS